MFIDVHVDIGLAGNASALHMHMAIIYPNPLPYTCTSCRTNNHCNLLSTPYSYLRGI